MEALKQGVDIIVCGRAYDPSPFAAIGIYHGKDPGLSYHLGKILECGAYARNREQRRIAFSAR
ncbi:acyclic terpene utilization AtuA family protein [Paenibacillus glucanolyticus]|uniref:acyclic terpene utilization AtuA family protein n=1 Tax=Paenibacillus glucanolyticus TaxID=59843 RepID=UPI003907F1F5